MVKASVSTEVDKISAQDLFYAYQTYALCCHIADAEGMVYDVSYPKWHVGHSRFRRVHIVPNLPESIDSALKKASGLDDYGSLIDTQEYPPEHLQPPGPYIALYTITPPPWMASRMTMGGRIVFEDIGTEAQPKCKLTNEANIEVAWFGLGYLFEQGVFRSLQNGYANLPGNVFKYRQDHQWKRMFHGLAFRQG